MQKTPAIADVVPSGHQRKQIHFGNPQAEKDFGKHFQKWCGSGGCIACPLHKNRKNLVLYRGHLPCDVLFIGEGPGRSEDMLGYPFVGDAGRELDDLIRRARQSTGRPPDFEDDPGPIKIGITNIVACLPLEPDKEGLSSGELRPPKKEEAVACRERLAEIIQLANPRLIVTLGDIARRFYGQALGNPKGSPTAPPGKVTIINLVHPSAILRTESPSQQVILEKRFVIQLADALRSL